LNSDVMTRQLRGLAVLRDRPNRIHTKPKGRIVEEEILIDLIAGENEVGIAAFNSVNTVQSELKTARIVASIPTEEPHIYVLVVGIDRYKDASSNLRYAVKDAQDMVERLSYKVTTVFKKRNIHIQTLYNEEATKDGIMDALQKIAEWIKATDSFILFVASHGVLNHGIYSIVTHDYSGYLQDASIVNSGAIMDSSKNIRALNQLLIFDTCHAGGIDNLFSGLYDARMTVLAKRMGLHMYASASTKQEALDGYRGNGLFTYAVIDGLRNNADVNSDRKVTIKELGNYSRDLTVKISSKIGYKQTPVTVSFGNDHTLFLVK
jgi:caspase domain-containing protein